MSDKINEELVADKDSCLDADNFDVSNRRSEDLWFIMTTVTVKIFIYYKVSSIRTSHTGCSEKRRKHVSVIEMSPVLNISYRSLKTLLSKSFRYVD
jgi:hypothetical protein